MTGWDISPFELESLRVSILLPPLTPESPRHGEDPDNCRSCQRRDEGIWFSDRWRLTRTDLTDLSNELAAELGVLSTHITRHVEALPHIGRCHVYRIGDGGAHLHLWFFARPAGQPQLLGSWLLDWDDPLPEYASAVAEHDASVVADRLMTSLGGQTR
jgi:hypothetical protein